jgi:hypothetical protein
MTETHRDMALRGEPVIVTLKRLKEMQEQAIAFEGVGDNWYHWHWAAVVNELLWLRKHSTIQLIYQQHVLSRVGSEFLLDLPEPPDAAADG